jgi:hypothetical protein
MKKEDCHFGGGNGNGTHTQIHNRHKLSLALPSGKSTPSLFPLPLSCGELRKLLGRLDSIGEHRRDKGEEEREILIVLLIIIIKKVLREKKRDGEGRDQKRRENHLAYFQNQTRRVR